MNEQTQNEHALDDQFPEGAQPLHDEPAPEGTEQTSSEEASAAQPPGKSKLNVGQFVAGFLGWFLVSLLIYAQKMDEESLMICGGLLFPVNVVILIILLRKLPHIGWGMLSALGANLVISLILGLVNNALCFIPFYKNP